MPESLDIIMFALPRWDAAYSSTAYSLAKEFSKKNRVFYIDNPFTFKFFITRIRSQEIKNRKSALLFGKKPFTEIKEGGAGNLIGVTPRLTIPINFLPPGKLYNLLSSINDRILYRTLQSLLEKYLIKDFILINSFNPFFLRKFPAFFRPKIFIYHVVDDIRHSAHISKHGSILENEMIRRVDLTLATSRQLQKIKSEIATNVFYLPNAADIPLFQRSIDGNFDRPSDIASITSPIVVYTGHIDNRIDYDLLEYCLKSHPDKLFLMIGPLSLVNKPMERLMSYENILTVGRKDLEELPAYLRYASCAIIPFKCNTLTSSIYPLKINEYLAAGKSVVSTPFSEDIVAFNDVIEIAKEFDAFSRSISTALNDSPDKLKKRVSIAKNNSWASRIELFWNIIDEFEEESRH